MSFILTCEVVIDKYKFNYANSIEVESAWQTLGDKCTLKLPNKAVLKKNDIESEEISLEKTFKTGMPVSIKVGYDGNNYQIFEGYISNIKPNTPLELMCEDEIYKMKRSEKISENFNGTLTELFQKHYQGSTISDKVPNVFLKNFMIKQATKAEIIMKIKEEYGLAVYFRGKTLYVGLPYFEGLEKKAILHFQKNVIDSDLEYKKEDDIRLKAKATSFLSNNTKITVEVGDSDGDQRSLFFHGITDETQLKALAENELSKLKFEGYRGSVTLFGEPQITHSGTVLLYDDRYSERKGQRYVVDKVKTTWGTNGFRQVVELGKKVSG